MVKETYIDEKFGTFDLYEFSHCTYYIVEEYKTGNYTLSIVVFVDNINDLNQCIERLYQLIENIEEMDKLAQKMFMERIEKMKSTEEDLDELKELEAAKKDLDEIKLDQICYYKDKNFELLYNLPEEAGVEYVKAIFNENNIVIDAVFGNY